ncbi:MULTISPECIES: DUF397 domain-containing protein [unclassified Spirillospora]|uniref:DUF397 domain-containing protein n=1 Tax=unclassified Spirillospora TaxID=2642701 RepID=UPI00371A62EF
MVDRSTRETSLYWRKSSASSPTDCVEVAVMGPSVLVRDSHDHSTGALALDSAQWNALVDAIQNGQLDGR